MWRVCSGRIWVNEWGREGMFEDSWIPPFRGNDGVWTEPCKSNSVTRLGGGPQCAERGTRF
jgi:hypothetical protein